MKDVIIFFIVILFAFYGAIQFTKKCTLHIIKLFRIYHTKSEKGGS